MKHLLRGVALAVLIVSAAPALAAKPAPVGVPIIPPADPAAAKAAVSPAAAKPEPTAAAAKTTASPAAEKAAASPVPAKPEPSTAPAVTATAIRHDRPMRHRAAWRRTAWHRAAWHRRQAWRYRWGRPPRSDRVAEQLNREELHRMTPTMPSRAPPH